jgi:hypothetical protein
MNDRLLVSVLLAVLAIVLGFIGWSTALFDGTFYSAAQIVMRVILSFIPAVERLQDGNALTQLSAILGALATFYSAILLLIEVLRVRMARMRVRRLWRGHAIIVGNTDLARRLCAAFKQRGDRVVQITATGDRPDLEGRRLRLSLGTDTDAIRKFCGLSRAAHVVVDTGDDIETLAIGRKLRADLTRAQGKTLALCVKDSVLADHLDDFFGLGRPQPTESAPPLTRPILFDENRVIARTILEREPLFVEASRRGQRRVHALILGFGDLGEKLLDQIMLTSIAGDLAAPRVTIVDREAPRQEQEFRVRRPGVLDTLDIAFVGLDVATELIEGGDRSPSLQRLFEIGAEDRITAIFVTLGSSLEIARTTMLFRQFQARTGAALAAPIYVHAGVSPSGSQILESMAAKKTEAAGRDESGRIVSMDLSPQILLEQTANPTGASALGRALHESYLGGEARSDHATQAWEFLPETLHRANVRAADHLRAKLWTLGFDISNWPPGVIPTLDAAGRQWLLGETGSEAHPDAREKLKQLARLEHDRWMIDRKLDGWRHAERRDNSQRLHPLLVPWEELRKSEGEVAKDVAQVRAALRFIVEHGQSRHALGRRA